MNPMHREARVQPACICFKNSRLWLISSRTRFCSARAAAEYCPCFQRDRRDLASPFSISRRFSQFDNIGQFAQHGGPKFPGKQGYMQGNFPFPLGVTSFLVAESER